MAATNDTHTVCHCYHLTNFAILTDMFDVVVSLFAEKTPIISTWTVQIDSKENREKKMLFLCQDEMASGHKAALSVLSYVGGVLSVICCAASIIIFQFFGYCHLLIHWNSDWANRNFLCSKREICCFVFSNQKSFCGDGAVGWISFVPRFGLHFRLKEELIRCHEMLALSIILSQLTFFGGVEATGNQVFEAYFLCGSRSLLQILSAVRHLLSFGYIAECLYDNRNWYALHSHVLVLLDVGWRTSHLHFIGQGFWEKTVHQEVCRDWLG